VQFAIGGDGWCSWPPVSVLLPLPMLLLLAQLPLHLMLRQLNLRLLLLLLLLSPIAKPSLKLLF
jgi:hypothetical protein